MVSLPEKFLVLLTVLLPTANIVAQVTELEACIRAYPGTEHEIIGKVIIEPVPGDKLGYFYNFNKAESSVVASTHIHAGTTCKDASQVGGLYGPGIGGTYTTNAVGKSRGNFDIDTNIALDDLDGYAVVVHAQNGAPIGCGILAEIGGCPMKACIKSYPGTINGVQGKISVSVDPEDNEITYNYALEGLKSKVTGAGTHIHAGTTCDDADLVGGHYWDAGVVGPDPWTAEYGAVYSTNKKGRAVGSFKLNSGYAAKDIIEHAVVVHASDGSRVGCGVLGDYRESCSVPPGSKPKKLRACMSPYPGYVSIDPIDISGKIVVEFDESTDEIIYSFNVKGLESKVTGAGTHIHAGTTCDDADLVGGHYWDAGVVGPDPWTAEYGAVYSTNKKGRAVGSFKLNSGYGYSDNVGHAVVVHASDGTRVSCGVLEEGLVNCK